MDREQDGALVERLRAAESTATHDDATTCWHRNPDGPEAADLIASLVEALEGLVRYAEAVRMSAGMGKNQLARLEAARAALAKANEGDGR